MNRILHILCKWQLHKSSIITCAIRQIPQVFTPLNETSTLQNTSTNVAATETVAL